MSGTLRLGLALLCSAVLVDLLLILPNHPNALRWPALTVVPLELPVLLLGMLALGGHARPLAFVATVALTLMTALKLADLSALCRLWPGLRSRWRTCISCRRRRICCAAARGWWARW